MAIHKIDGVDGVVNYPKKFVTLWTTLAASASITKGDVVILETDITQANGEGLYVQPSDASDSVITVGVAAETVTNPAGATRDHPIRVQVAGYNDTCTSAASIALDVLVSSSASGDVRTAADTSNTAKPFAICVNAFAGTTNDGAILIFDHGMYG